MRIAYSAGRIGPNVVEDVIVGNSNVATTTGRLVRTPSADGRSPRRGMVPVSGLMILFAVLMFGLALAIPASRAIQEAQMRDRIAGVAGATDDSGDANESNASQLPAIAELDEDDDDEDDGDENPGERENEPPPAIEDATRGTDLAEKINGLRASGSGVDGEDEEERAPALTHISIPSVEIDTEIYEVGYEVHEIDGQRVREWEVASYAAGHHKTSGRPGEGNNIVVTGHNDWEGEVFRTLEFIEHGDEVVISTEEGDHRYVVEEIHMRREIGATLEERLETGRFMADMPEERLTLITCWPYGINDHRVIVVALPVD
jgi:LPXTG-site transpeptidase (sortase) family protein